MKHLFQKKELKKPTLIQKLLNKEPKENSLIKLNNLLAQKEILEITRGDITEIENKHKLKLTEDFPREIATIYEGIISELVKNINCSENDKKTIDHFANVLEIADSKKDKSYQTVVERYAKEILTDLIDNYTLPENYDDKTSEIQKNLKISPEIIESISKNVRAKSLQSLFEQITENQRISPDEYNRLLKSAESLKIEFKLDDESASAVEKMKEYWEIENGELTPIDCNINLQKSELCYKTLDVTWKEKRKVTKRINYAGPTAKIKIMKGVHYRVGSAQVQRITNEELVEVDKGTLYITSKRIIFVGSKKNSNIRYNKILSFIPYKDGIEVVKDAGRNPFFLCKTISEDTHLILNRLLNE